ncbi:MAG: hypothetical protein EOO06_13435 [Chitinophagaceae bacterium]|nr:MAG: hypothetical protein EOO06_13435 [Chitinophagaceae bacterium]
MNTFWANRNPIVANLFNPAFCGEVIRVAANGFTSQSNNDFPFAFSFLILPILLHKETRDSMPRTTRSYLFAWVEENDGLFYDFGKRTQGMVRFTREALSFSLMYRRIYITENGCIKANASKMKLRGKDGYEEYDEILRKADMLGKWLGKTNDVKSIYSFFRITP